MTKTFPLELKTGMFVPYQGMALVHFQQRPRRATTAGNSPDLPGPQDGSWRMAPLR